MTENNKEAFPSPEEQKNETTKKQSTDNGLVQLLEVAKSLFEMFMEYKEKEAEARTKEADARIKYFQQASKHNRNVLYSMTIFLVAIVGLMTILTWVGKVSGDALLFLVGTIVGYLILFIQKLASPTEEQPIEPATE